MDFYMVTDEKTAKCILAAGSFAAHGESYPFSNHPFIHQPNYKWRKEGETEIRTGEFVSMLGRPPSVQKGQVVFVIDLDDAIYCTLPQVKVPEAVEEACIRVRLVPGHLVDGALRAVHIGDQEPDGEVTELCTIEQIADAANATVGG